VLDGIKRCAKQKAVGLLEQGPCRFACSVSIYPKGTSDVIYHEAWSVPLPEDICPHDEDEPR